jgi:hypothetical protein
MNDPEFYNSSDTAGFFTGYNALKAGHTKKMEEWEQLQLQLENFA